MKVELLYKKLPNRWDSISSSARWVYCRGPRLIVALPHAPATYT